MILWNMIKPSFHSTLGGDVIYHWYYHSYSHCLRMFLTRWQIHIKRESKILVTSQCRFCQPIKKRWQGWLYYCTVVWDQSIYVLLSLPTTLNTKCDKEFFNDTNLISILWVFIFCSSHSGTCHGGSVGAISASEYWWCIVLVISSPCYHYHSWFNCEINRFKMRPLCAPLLLYRFRQIDSISEVESHPKIVVFYNLQDCKDWTHSLWSIILSIIVCINKLQCNR